LSCNSSSAVGSLLSGTPQIFFTPWRAKNWSRWSEVGPLWQPSFIKARFLPQGDSADMEGRGKTAAPSAVETIKSLRFICVPCVTESQTGTPFNAFDAPQNSGHTGCSCAQCYLLR